MNRFFVLIVLKLILSQGALAALPEADPAMLGFDPARLALIDGAVNESISRTKLPGALVLVGRHGKIAYVKAFGHRSLIPAAEPMTRDTIFDLASLTKPLATASSVMKLLEDGKLRLKDSLAQLLPEFDNHGKGAITLEQLLRHRAGLIADNPISDYKDGPELAWSRLANLDLPGTPGAALVYSDVGFLILGRIVERISGQSLDQYAKASIFDPLLMRDTSFRPSENAKVAPTEPDPATGQMLRGVVHDPRSRSTGGIAGHAGLFGTGDDLALYAHALLSGGRGVDGTRVLSPLAVRLMTSPGSSPPGQKRGLGWDVDSPQSGPRGELYSTNGFGHTGFTGTSLWVDKETDSFVVLLTSRLHPDAKGASPTTLRNRVATLVASAIVDLPAGSSSSSFPESHSGHPSENKGRIRAAPPRSP